MFAARESRCRKLLGAAGESLLWGNRCCGELLGAAGAGDRLVLVLLDAGAALGASVLVLLRVVSWAMQL